MRSPWGVALPILESPAPVAAHHAKCVAQILARLGHLCHGVTSTWPCHETGSTATLARNVTPIARC